MVLTSGSQPGSGRPPVGEAIQTAGSDDALVIAPLKHPRRGAGQCWKKNNLLSPRRCLLLFTASGRTLTVLSDEKGLATGRGLVPNQIAGKFEILVTVSFHESRAKAVITQTNAEPAEEANKGSSKKLLLIALIGGAAAGGAALAAMGHGGSNASAPSPTSSPSGALIIPGVPVFQSPH